MERAKRVAAAWCAWTAPFKTEHYISPMLVKVLRMLWVLLAGGAPLLQASAQGSGTLLLDPEALDVQSARVPGIGATTGIELHEHQVIRYLNGDSANYSTRSLDDEHWPIARLDSLADTSTSKVWWLRYHIQPDAEKMRGAVSYTHLTLPTSDLV